MHASLVIIWLNRELKFYANDLCAMMNVASIKKKQGLLQAFGIFISCVSFSIHFCTTQNIVGFLCFHCMLPIKIPSFYMVTHVYVLALRPFVMKGERLVWTLG